MHDNSPDADRQHKKPKRNDTTIYKTKTDADSRSLESPRGLDGGLERPMKREGRGGEQGQAKGTRGRKRHDTRHNGKADQAVKTASTQDRLIWRAGKENDPRTGGSLQSEPTDAGIISLRIF